MRCLVILFGLAVMTGCSSTPKLVVDQSQYCHTSSTKILKDSTTSSSEVIVECSDKPNPKMTLQSGFDGRKCGWARQSYPVAGKLTTSYTMACQLQDGSWTYVPNVIAQ